MLLLNLNQIGFSLTRRSQFKTCWKTYISDIKSRTKLTDVFEGISQYDILYKRQYWHFIERDKIVRIFFVHIRTTHILDFWQALNRNWSLQIFSATSSLHLKQKNELMCDSDFDIINSQMIIIVHNYEMVPILL